MPPTIYIVRHGEGENNINNSHWIKDSVLTPAGKAQCQKLQSQFPHQKKLNAVMSSPLRRAIQTAAIAFSPAINRPEVPYLVVPLGQEANDVQCDIGHSRAELEEQLEHLLGGTEVGFDLGKVNLELVEDGWNSKTGKWAAEKEVVKKRAAELRSWLYQRPEDHIAFVTHGAFIHFLTEDWTGDDPVRGTGYLNCEVRIFNFTEDSTSDNAHIMEKEENKAIRIRPTLD